MTSYDIADVVRAAVALRKKSQPDRASIIDKLIEEALVEFTSLQDDKGAPAARPADAPSEPQKRGFEDIGNWADELGPMSRKPPGLLLLRRRATSPRSKRPTRS